MTDPAPESVYKSERDGASFSYTFPNLQPTQCTVRLHFAEYEYSAAGKRTFNVSINGQTVLPGFDVYQAAGAKYKAVVVSLTATPDSNGKITISFTGVVKAAEIKGIEILGQHVDLDLTGTAKDSKGNDNILVGQQCTAKLTVTPDGGSGQATYQWDIHGTTFQSWKPGDPSSSFSDGSGPLTKQTASWCWNDAISSGKSKTETVSCTITPPASQGSPFTLTKKVKVWEPKWTAYGVGGIMKVSKYPFAKQEGFNPDDYCLWASPADGSDETGGITWHCTFASPNTALFGDGTIKMEQIINPMRFYTASDGSAHWSINGLAGSDAPFPVAWVSTTPDYYSGDAPCSDLQTPPDLISETDKDSFEDYLMYQPPDSMQYVPLATFNWSTNGSATIPKSGKWSDYKDSPGTVSPSGKENFTPTKSNDDFPKWVRVDSAKAPYDPD